MAVQLVVRRPFAGYQIGQHITDQALVSKYQASHPSYVIPKVLEVDPSIPRVPTPPPAVPAAPTPAPKAPAQPAPASTPASTTSPSPPKLTPIA